MYVDRSVKTDCQRFIHVHNLCAWYSFVMLSTLTVSYINRINNYHNFNAMLSFLWTRIYFKKVRTTNVLSCEIITMCQCKAVVDAQSLDK